MDPSRSHTVEAPTNFIWWSWQQTEGWLILQKGGFDSGDQEKNALSIRCLWNWWVCLCRLQVVGKEVKTLGIGVCWRGDDDRRKRGKRDRATMAYGMPLTRKSINRTAQTHLLG